MIKRFAAAALAAFALLFAASVPAQSWTSNNTYVDNHTASNGYLTIWEQTGNLYWNLPAGGYSAYKTNDVDGFYIGSSCPATSQWGYTYTGPKWYYPANGTKLVLTVKCR